MGKVNLSATVEEEIKDALEDLRQPTKLNRSLSNMTDTLLREALVARKYPFPKKAKRGK